MRLPRRAATALRQRDLARACATAARERGALSRRRWCRSRDVELGLPCDDRRLHRLLHEHPPRDHRRQAVPPRQPAAAELQVGADRLPRPGLVDRSPAASRSAARSARPRRPTPSAPTLGAEPAARLRARARRRRSAGRNALGAARSRSPTPKTTSSASRCSTTGARATSRPGNTSRWALPVEELREHDLALDGDARRAGAVPRPPTPRPEGDPAAAALPRLGRPTARTAPSTSSSKSGCRPRRCAQPAMPATG